MKILHLTEETLRAIECHRTGWVHFYYDVDLSENNEEGDVYIEFENPEDAFKLGWEVQEYEQTNR